MTSIENTSDKWREYALALSIALVYIHNDPSMKNIYASIEELGNACAHAMYTEDFEELAQESERPYVAKEEEVEDDVIDAWLNCLQPHEYYVQI